MLLVGGEVIRGFSFVLIVGMLAGTYSSLYIAAPVLIEFAKWRAEKDRRKLEEAKKKMDTQGKPVRV
jgi:preprotein translocase subunit SecF